MFEAVKITEKNKKQLFYEKGIYSKIFYRRFLAFALFAYGFFGFAGDFVGAKSSVSAYGENAVDVTADGERSADNDSGAANFTNLIVFARFSDEEEFIDTSYDGVSVRQLIENTYTVGGIPWQIITMPRRTETSVCKICTCFRAAARCNFLNRAATMRKKRNRTKMVTKAEKRL